MENETYLDEYLKRVELDRPVNAPDEEYLNQLHIAHLTHIPFENFDLIDLKQLDISLDYIFNRLVRQQRGGICFQLNGLFESILKLLNYNVQMIPCYAYNINTNRYISRYDHAALYVTLNDGRKLLCDVGFSRNFLTPLIFRTDCIQFATNGFFRLTKTDDELYYTLERGFLDKNDDLSLPYSSKPQTHIIDINPERIKWVKSYRFPIDFLNRSTKLEDFRDTCEFILYSSETRLNHFTIVRMEKYQPILGAYGIVGKEYWEWIVENGIETRKHFPISNDDNELKNLLKEKFNLIIERKLELADN